MDIMKMIAAQMIRDEQIEREKKLGKIKRRMKWNQQAIKRIGKKSQYRRSIQGGV